jgi:hypothetical protein
MHRTELFSVQRPPIDRLLNVLDSQIFPLDVVFKGFDRGHSRKRPEPSELVLSTLAATSQL